MEIRQANLVPRRRRLGGAAARVRAVVALLSIVSLASASGALAVLTPVNLGTAASFAVLANIAVTNTGPTTVIGNLGLSSGSFVTGFPPGVVLGGVHVADAAAIQAQTDLVTAYNTVAGESPATPLASPVTSALTLTPGVYQSTSVLDINGVTLTLDAQNDSAALFIFQVPSSLTMLSGSQVKLVNGASPCNVFWQVGSSATLGTNIGFEGTLLALESIAVATGTTVDGRLLARTGDVILDSNTIDASACQVSSQPLFTDQFLPPLAQSTDPANPVINTGKNGRVIPVKVQISQGATAITDANAPGPVTVAVSKLASCSSSAGSDPIATYADAGQSSAGTNQFRYDATAQAWIYNLDTKALGLVTGNCYRIDVSVNGTQIANAFAVFQPTK
jgi:hypothetical protein